MSLCGVLNFNCLAVPGTRNKVNAAINVLDPFVRINKSLHDKIFIPSEADVKNINSIMSLMQASDWFKVAIHEKTFEIFTDASLNSEVI